MNGVEHRNLEAQEVLFLTIVAAHRGTDPLLLKQIERRMRPHACNEDFLVQAGYIAQGRNPKGRPIRGSFIVTSEGRLAIAAHIRPAIAKIEARITTQPLPAAAEVDRALVKTLTDRLEDYPGPETVESGDAGEDDDDDQVENDGGQGTEDPEPKRSTRPGPRRPPEPEPATPAVSRTGRPRPSPRARPKPPAAVKPSDDGA